MLLTNQVWTSPEPDGTIVNFEARIVLDGGEMDMVLRLAETGLGIALMPRLALDDSRRLIALRVSDQQLQRTMALVSREDRALAPAARALREFLEGQLVRRPDANAR